MAWLITVEGGDGSGKSTLLARIEEHLKNQKISFLRTREPGGTAVAEKIRDLLLDPVNAMEPMAELFLYEASRSEHVSKVIRPALNAGTNVICDRFTHSSLAYQGFARGLGKDLVTQMNLAATGGLEPNAVIWLKLSPEEAKRRTASRGAESRLDQEKSSFHKTVFEAFETISRADVDHFIILDASKSPEDVFQQLLAHPLWKKTLQT